MSAIDQLRDGNIMIDTTEDEPENPAVSVELGQRDHHTFVPNNAVVSNNRKAIDINTVAEPEPKDPTIKESYEKDILNTDDLNSMFSKYINRKVEEANEWLAEKKEEDMLADEEKSELDDPDNNPLNESISFNEFKNNVNTEILDDEDLSSLMDNDEDYNKNEDNEEDNISMSNNELDRRGYPVEEINTTTEEKNNENETVKSDNDNKKPKEPEGYYADDIDVEVENSNESFTTEIEDENEAEIADVDRDETLKKLQRLATEKLKPISKKLDIRSFTVLKKPAANISSIFKDTNAKVAKWVLPAQQSIVLMKEFSGAELEKLREYTTEGRNSVDALSRRYKLIYDHIVSPKPATFEQWLKTTPVEDVDHYFFAIYVSSFKGANYLPADCINKDCKETFISDNIEIMNMVKFDTKEGKKKFMDLYQSEATPAGKGVYCTEIVPISSSIAIGFKQPSIWNLMEIFYLSEEFRRNHASIIEYIPYINTIYNIDQENQTLTPISYKMYADNNQKTVKSKVIKYDNILNTLAVDEFGVIKAYVSAIADKSEDIKYIYPALECPKCHSMTEEQVTQAEDLVFTRYQLGALVNISLN